MERFIISLCYDFVMLFSWFGSVWNLQVSKMYGDSILSTTKRALIYHIHKSAYVSGHILSRSNLPNKTDGSLSNWTWNISSDKVLYNWHSPNNTSLPENLAYIVFKKCDSRLKSKKNGSRKKENVSCILICKCEGKRDVLPLKTDTFLYAFVVFYECLHWIKFHFNLLYWLCLFVWVGADVFA